MKTITAKIPDALADDVDEFIGETGTKKWIFVATALRDLLAVPKAARLTRMSDYAKSMKDDSK
jgi:hypothetical protein